MILIRTIKFHLGEILNRIAESDDIKVVKENESKLMMAMLGPMLLIAATVSVIIGLYWQESLLRIVKECVKKSL